jgi:hypothetical protein
MLDCRLPSPIIISASHCSARRSRGCSVLEGSTGASSLRECSAVIVFETRHGGVLMPDPLATRKHLVPAVNREQRRGTILLLPGSITPVLCSASLTWSCQRTPDTEKRNPYFRPTPNRLRVQREEQALLGSKPRDRSLNRKRARASHTVPSLRPHLYYGNLMQNPPRASQLPPLFYVSGRTYVGIYGALGNGKGCHLPGACAPGY